MTKHKETAATRCSKLEAANVGLTLEIEQSLTLNETLKKSLQDAQVDFLSAGDEAFERAKAQDLCIASYLDVSRMDFFKVVVGGQLVDMEEVSPKIEGLKDVMVDNPTSEAQVDNHEILIYLSLVVGHQR